MGLEKEKKKGIAHVKYETAKKSPPPPPPPPMLLEEFAENVNKTDQAG